MWPGMASQTSPGSTPITDVTGFGYWVTLLEMFRGIAWVRGSITSNLPLLPGVLALAEVGVADVASREIVSRTGGRCRLRT